MSKALTRKQAAFVREYLVDLNATQAAIRTGCEILTKGWPDGYYVYALLDQEADRIFYVGKGVRARWLSHYREGVGHGNVGKRQRIRSVPRPACVVLAAGLSEPEAYDNERAAIAALSATGLTNLAPGQRSETERTRDIAREMLSAVPPYAEWFADEPRTEAQVVMYHRIVAELRRGAERGWSTRWRSVNGGPWQAVA